MQHGWWTSNTCRYCLAVTVAIYLRLCVVFNCRLRNLFQFTTSLVLMVSVDLVEECCRLCVLKTMKEKGAWKEAWDDACVLQKFLMSGWWWSNLVIESLFQPKEAQNVKRIPNKQTKGSPSNFAKRRYVLLPSFLSSSLLLKKDRGRIASNCEAMKGRWNISFRQNKKREKTFLASVLLLLWTRESVNSFWQTDSPCRMGSSQDFSRLVAVFLLSKRGCPVSPSFRTHKRERDMQYPQQIEKTQRFLSFGSQEKWRTWEMRRRASHSGFSEEIVEREWEEVKTVDSEQQDIRRRAWHLKHSLRETEYEDRVGNFCVTAMASSILLYAHFYVTSFFLLQDISSWLKMSLSDVSCLVLSVQQQQVSWRSMTIVGRFLFRKENS